MFLAIGASGPSSGLTNLSTKLGSDQVPIFLYSLIEKAFMVFLVATNAHLSYSEGFYVPATMDAIIVLYSLLYFWSRRRV